MKDFLYSLKAKPTRATIFTMLSLLALGTYSSFAQEDAGPTVADAIFTANNIWMLVATFLVFIMHLGFASIETGLTRAKNTTNILFKNVSIIAIGILTYAIVGFDKSTSSSFFRKHLT